MGLFSDDQIRAIRKSTKGPGALAKEYGVSRITIYNIQGYITYAKVPDDPPPAPPPDMVMTLPGYSVVEIRYGIGSRQSSKGSKR